MADIKKVLIVPVETIVEKEPDTPGAVLLYRGLRHLKRIVGAKPSVYDGELQYYADMPLLLGRDHVYVFGRYLPHFYSQSIPADCAYPLCHGIPRPTVLARFREVERVLPSVDAVLISTRAGLRGRAVGELARRRGVPVLLIDYKDHMDIFRKPSVSEAEICRGFEHGKDFDLYFKKDLPLGRKTKTILPLGLTPTRAESYDFRRLPKDITIFYSGRVKGPKSVGDRNEIGNFIKERFPGTVFLEHASRSTFLSLREYLDHLARTKIALSPAGNVWDAIRHCEVGLAPETALLTPVPCAEFVGPPFQDGVNAILYTTELRDGKYRLVDGNALVEKVAYYLKNDNARIRIANQWKKDILVGHTGTARARYLLESVARGMS